MNLRAVALSLALVSAAVPAFAAADANAFSLVTRDGKPIGKATYTIAKGKDGYHVTAKFQYHYLPAGGGTGGTLDPDSKAGPVSLMVEGQFTSDYKVTEDGNYLSGYTQNAATQMLTGFQPDKARKVLTINQNQGGIGLGSRSLDLPKPEFLVAPDYDPSILQVLLTTAIAHPHADSTYTLIVPSSNPKSNNTAMYVTLQLAPETAAGTLDGKPITLKHYVMMYHTGRADLYIDEAGNLMEADMGPLATNYVRLKFALAAQ